MILQQRDFLILTNINKWRFLLGRHVRALVGFSGQRAADRRLKLLIEEKYIKRQKILYGVPYLYTLAHKGRILIGANKREDKIRIEQIHHDILVLDTVLYFTKKYTLDVKTITSEKELHSRMGFGTRKHCPDFVFEKNGESYAVEVELSEKAKERLSKNIEMNFLNYDYQIWIIDNNQRIAYNIMELSTKYPNVEILQAEVIKNSGK